MMVEFGGSCWVGLGKMSVAGRRRSERGRSTSCLSSLEAGTEFAAGVVDVVEAAGFAVVADGVAVDDE